MNQLKYDTNQIIIIGDIHAEFHTFNHKLQRLKIQNTLLIQVGDFGIGFTSNDLLILSNLNDKLKANNNTLIIVRGNHDKPTYFNGNFKYSNLKLVPDYTLIQTLKGNIVCIGGAASIDKEFRTEGVSWWKDELPIYDLKALKELENSKIDYVMAHSNPDFCYPLTKSTLSGEEIIKYAKKSRLILTRNYEYLSNFHTIKYWYNGHYHWNNEERIKGTKFITLDITEFKSLT